MLSVSSSFLNFPPTRFLWCFSRKWWQKDWTWCDKPAFTISIVSDGRDGLLKDKRGLFLRGTSTKRRKEFNIASRDTDWCFVNEDANLAHDSFIEKNTGIFDTYFPFNIIKGKELTKNSKPWISRGLLKPFNQKKKLYRQYLSPHLDDMVGWIHTKYAKISWRDY